MSPICPHCETTFTYSAVEHFLHQHTGEPLPVACRLCRLLGQRHAVELHNATQPRTTGWGKANDIQKRRIRHQTAEDLYPCIVAWIHAHQGAIPTVKDFQGDPTLPPLSTVQALCGPFPRLYAALETRGVPGALAAYRARLAATQARDTRKAGLASAAKKRHGAPQTCLPWNCPGAEVAS